MINLVEVVGTVAIVVTLVFVAYELRQSNRLGRLEAMQAMADAWLFTGWEIAGNREMAALLARVGEGAVQSDFDSAENYQAFSVFYAADHHWAMRYSQLQLGILDADDYSFPTSANPTYNSDYHREVWPVIRAEFSDDFARFWESRFELNRE